MAPPSRRAFALLLAVILVGLGCPGSSSKDERAPRAAVSQPTSSAGPKVATPQKYPPTRRTEPDKPASPLVEQDGLDKLEHKPLIVLKESNPWLMVVGSDVPSVVVYEDGLVVYKKPVGEKAEALTANVGPDGAQQLVSEIATRDFMALPARSSVSAATDQPTVGIALRRGSQWKYVSVYGLGRDGKATVASEGEAPAAFVSAYQRLANFDAPGATPWVPDTLEIMLWDFSHARNAPLPWPAGIPAPPPSVKPPKDGVYRHYVPARHEAAVRAFIASLGQSQGVSVGGVSTSIGVRRVVPSDDYIETAIMCAWTKSIPGAKTPAGCH